MREANRPKSAGSSASSGQHDRFLETARAVGCDEDEAAFDEKLKGIALQKPKAFEITPHQRKLIDAETAAGKPQKPALDLEGQLAEAKQELGSWQRRFGDYDGNNPRKYSSDIRQAAARVRRLESALRRRT